MRGGIWCHRERNRDGTEKKSYGARSSAASAAAKLLNIGAADEVRIYPCPAGGCGGWHVTSHPLTEPPK